VLNAEWLLGGNVLGYAKFLWRATVGLQAYVFFIHVPNRNRFMSEVAGFYVWSFKFRALGLEI